jgi:hypothetical protein
MLVCLVELINLDWIFYGSWYVLIRWDFARLFYYIIVLNCKLGWWLFGDNVNVRLCWLVDSGNLSRVFIFIIISISTDLVLF